MQVLDEAIEAAVQLSHRYIPARQLPDKSVSLLDTACARVAISQHAVPPSRGLPRRIEALETELEIIDREEAVGIDADERRKAAEEKLAVERGASRLVGAALEGRERLVERVLGIRAKLRQGSAPVEGTGSKLEQAAEAQKARCGASRRNESLAWKSDGNCLAELRRLQAKLADLQGESPLILPSVDEQAVASVVQDWTGIPVGRMVKNEIETVLNLADTLSQRVIGQRHALDMIAKRIQTSRARLDNPNKPIGVFMLVRPLRRRQDRNGA